jgi:transcriptional regulator with XRE-family HTH domain
MTTAQAKQLGALVARARARKGLSLRDLAGQLGLARSWLGYLEQGRYVDPGPDRLARIAEALDLEPTQIDRITRGAVSDGLPDMRTYFRAKYALTPEQIAQIERYVERYTEPPEEAA